MEKRDDLNLIVMDNARELGEKINDELKRMRNTDKDFIIPVDRCRFQNGEGKIKIMESVREKDLYILSDVGNYDISYPLHNREHFMTPDEHFADVKRVIAASSNHARRVSVVMPLLYESRQHKRKGRESLDCAMALQEIENLNIKSYVTLDAHDPSVANAVPRMAFDNFYATSKILLTLFKTEENILGDYIVLAPDIGAVERSRFYADMIGCDVGFYNKRRDYSKIVNGKNPIVEHQYFGPDIDGKNVIIVDDMIASGGSVLDVAKRAHESGAKKIYICVTFALFTEGIGEFQKYFEAGYFDRIYGTNATYVPESIKRLPWYVDVDTSTLFASIINKLNNGESLEPLHYDGQETYKKLKLMRH